MPTKPWRELVKKMSPERQAAIKARARCMSLELRLEELRVLVERHLAQV